MEAFKTYITSIDGLFQLTTVIMGGLSIFAGVLGILAEGIAGEVSIFIIGLYSMCVLT